MWKAYAKKWFKLPVKNLLPNWSAPAWLEQVQSISLLAYCLTLPWNLFLKFGTQNAYVNGLLVDYLLGKIFLFEVFALIFIISSLLLNGRNYWKKLWRWGREQDWIVFTMLLLWLLRQGWASQPLASYSWLAHPFLSLIFFGVLVEVLQEKTSKIRQKFLLWLGISLLFQTALGSFQFLFQKNLLPYMWLGESRLSDFAGISHGNFFAAERILAYGSSAHPNILAAFVVLTGLFLLESRSGLTNTLWKKLILSLLLAWVIFITQSFSALLTVGLYAVYRLLLELKKNWPIQLPIFALYICTLVFFPLMLLNFSQQTTNTSVLRRVWLNQAAFSMIEANALTGVGWNNFTTQVEKYSQHREIQRFIQPVHHLVLLFLAENGLLGIFALIFLFKKGVPRGLFLAAVPLLAFAALDHFLFTQAIGWQLLGLSWLFFFVKFPKTRENN